MEALVQRVCGEYREMPGLQLTLAQACRLWQLDAPTCEEVLTCLVRDGVLLRTRFGHYIAARHSHARRARIFRPQRAAS